MFEELLWTRRNIRSKEFCEREIWIERDRFIEVCNRICDAKLLREIASRKKFLPGLVRRSRNSNLAAWRRSRRCARRGRFVWLNGLTSRKSEGTDNQRQVEECNQGSVMIVSHCLAITPLSR